MPAKALLFDVGYTLQDDGMLFEKSLEHAGKWLKAKGAISSAEKFRKAYLHFDARMHSYKYSHVFGEEDIMRRALKKLGADTKPAKGAVEEWRAFQKARFKPNRKFRKALVWARMEGFRTAIVSNDRSERMNALLQVHGVRPFLNAVIVSEEAGTEKPKKKIFELALRKLRVKPHNAVMFGDSPVADGAAKRLGIKWVKVKKFDRGALWEKGKKFSPDQEIPEISRESLQRVLAGL